MSTEATGSGEFSGLTAVVTGGASGIGLATARELHQRGAAIAVLDRQALSPESDFLVLRCDVTDSAAVDSSMAEVAKHFGQIDILVNNAGVEARGTVENGTAEEFAHVLDINVIGMFRTISAALPYLRRSSVPAIVNTCSVAALRGMSGLAIYSASKGAVLALTRSVAADLIGEGIRVNCVCPGTVDTPWIGRLLSASGSPDAIRSILEARQPMGRLISADEVARAIAYLASPLASSITAAALEIDGGTVGLIPNAPDVSAPSLAAPIGRMTDLQETSDSTPSLG